MRDVWVGALQVFLVVSLIPSRDSLSSFYTLLVLLNIRQPRRPGGRNELHRSGRLVGKLSVPEHESGLV
jgi:hypothetical protein